MKRVKAKGIEVVVHEPELDQKEFFGSPVITDLEEFKLMSDIIVANRKSASLKDVDNKCFSRDLFGDN
jgi:UDPglucose 6-dehydrogenase